jgi:hypothetical protein
MWLFGNFWYFESKDFVTAFYVISHNSQDIRPTDRRARKLSVTAE